MPKQAISCPLPRIASEVTGEMNRIVSEMIRIFEGCLPELASAIAAKFQLSQREVLHLLRSEFRQAREQLVAVAERLDVELILAPDDSRVDDEGDRVALRRLPIRAFEE